MDFSALFEPVVITSVGGIVLSMILIWVLYKFAGNHVNHNTKALSEMNSNLAVNTEVQRAMKGAIEDLSDVIRSIK